MTDTPERAREDDEMPKCRHCGQAIFFEHATDCPAIPTAGPAPIPLNPAQESAVQEWAADDRLWTTQETVEFNLRTFARLILKLTGGSDAV